MKFYLVGGAVRDQLLGFEHAEQDWVVVGATPEDLVSRGFKPKDAEFPVFIHPQSGEEYALARRERKTAPGHKGFVVESGPDVTLEDDLIRRDLRVNAMARSESGELIDPHHGKADIESRTLRHVSPAFVEDPLRVLRAARFAARFDSLGFSIHPSTLKLMRKMSTGEELAALSNARIWRETEKALATGKPGRYFDELAECGALKQLPPKQNSNLCDAVYAPENRRLILAAADAAAVIDPRSEVSFAALVCALTDAADDAVIVALCAAYPIPRKHAELARLVTALRADLFSTERLSPARLLEVLQTADAFRRPERFRDALVVYRALESAGASQLGATRAKLEKAFAAARTIDGAKVSRAGLEGGEIARELRQRRLLAIEEALARSQKRS